ncbi:uncharacterized protein LOC134667617 [Cydia fagiglandana]|uniref:uncharacterized protein LOC134667617 n=1 Tax=Cydia fagiglandana TaxID=1458189 RepID=UPI002FEE402A
MRKFLPLILVFCFADSSPVSVGTLQFDNLDTDLDDLKYEVEEEDLDDYSKLLDEAEDEKKTKAKTTGYEKSNKASKGLKGKKTVTDLKKFFKGLGAEDEGYYDDVAAYALAEAAAAKAVGVKGKEDRTYRKGTKTRGFHRVHHKDEYKKDKVFYEDDETKGSINKVGAKGSGYSLSGGAGFNKGHIHHKLKKGVYGKQGYSDKGTFEKEFEGYGDSEGFDTKYSSDS